MKTKLFVAALALALVSCGQNKQESQPSEQAEAQEMQEEVNPLPGQWNMIDIATGSAVENVRDDHNFSINFLTDGTFSVQTDCNSIFGEYEINGDSLKFDNIASTMMTCPDEKYESIIKEMLPIVDTYAITPDTILILRSDMRTLATFHGININNFRAD